MGFLGALTLKHPPKGVSLTRRYGSEAWTRELLEAIVRHFRQRMMAIITRHHLGSGIADCGWVVGQPERAGQKDADRRLSIHRTNTDS
jgi:hypothetical protein